MTVSNHARARFLLFVLDVKKGRGFKRAKHVAALVHPTSAFSSGPKTGFPAPNSRRTCRTVLGLEGEVAARSKQLVFFVETENTEPRNSVGFSFCRFELRAQFELGAQFSRRRLTLFDHTRHRHTVSAKLHVVGQSCCHLPVGHSGQQPIATFAAPFGLCGVSRKPARVSLSRLACLTLVTRKRLATVALRTVASRPHHCHCVRPQHKL